MNLWAKNSTKGLIKEVLPPFAINKETICILANALYFKGAWLNAFDSAWRFYPLNGEPIQVPFVVENTKGKHLYGSFKDFEVLKIPYQKGFLEKRDGLQISFKSSIPPELF